MNRRVLFAVAICSFFACIVCSNQSLALELTDNSVHYYGTYSNVYTYCASTNTWAYDCSGSTANYEAVRFYDNAATFPSGGYYIEIYLEIANWDGNAPLWYGASSSGNINIVQEEQVSSTTRGNTTTRVYRLVGRWTGGTAITSSYPGIILNSSYLGAWSHYKVQYFTLWQVVSADASNQQIIDTINSQSQTLDSIDSGIQDLRSAQEQANDDANDRYEDEKQTIQDNGDQAQDDMDDFSSSASFSLGNPIAGIFNYFVDTCTVQIPTISSWLGSSETSVTSWWCKTQKLQTIRNTVTTILSFTGVLLTFGFLIRWLRTNQGEA